MNELILRWIIFILAFGGMILVHELGHFIAARLVKVEVEEFGIGFPTPGAITLFTYALHSTGFPLVDLSARRVKMTRKWREGWLHLLHGSACSSSLQVPS